MLYPLRVPSRVLGFVWLTSEEFRTSPITTDFLILIWPTKRGVRMEREVTLTSSWAVKAEGQVQDIISLRNTSFLILPWEAGSTGPNLKVLG